MNCCVYLANNPPFINDPTVYNGTNSVAIMCLFNAHRPRGVVWQRNRHTAKNIFKSWACETSNNICKELSSECAVSYHRWLTDLELE